MVCIYMITNKINNKKYIGQTLNFKKRKKDHICNARDNKINTHLYLAMRKYGIENFKFDILEEVKKEELNDKEIYYIKKYDTFNTGYNMTNGGENVTLNNPEVRKKISMANKGKQATKPVNQYDKEKNFIRSFNSLSEASAITNTSVSDICTCCKGRLHTANGYIWEYKESECEGDINECSK